MNNKYQAAIDFRLASLARLQTSPPTEWSAEYVEKNVRAIEEQIRRLTQTGERT